MWTHFFSKNVENQTKSLNVYNICYIYIVIFRDFLRFKTQKAKPMVVGFGSFVESLALLSSRIDG